MKLSTLFSAEPADARRYYRARRPRRKKPLPRSKLPLLCATGAFLLALKYLLSARVHVSLRPRAPSRPPSPAMRPPQFDDHTPARLHADERTLRALADAAADPPREPPAHPGESLPVPRDATANRRPPRKAVSKEEARTRTCYHSARTGDALCVHVPFCVRHAAIAYLSDTLRCAAYSNQQHRMGTLSMTRCVELERDLEGVAEIHQVEHKPVTWVDQLQAAGNILWFEGDTVFLRMSARAKSVAHYADRIFLLHHVLQHPQRYGMGAVSNVVIAADEQVAKKIRYTKSWHHGLLAAIVHPNKPIYSHRTIRELVGSLPSDPGEIRVFVPSGMWDVAKGKLVPCFRRAALPGAVRSQFFLDEEKYLGVVDAGAATSPRRFHDADVFRTLLFQSLGHEGPPRIKRHVLYLHRASTRALTNQGLGLLQEKLRTIASTNTFSYQQLDVSGMTFPQQIEAVAGAGVVIGVHGTQMLNTLFLPSGAAIVEIFPFGFANRLFENGSGAGLHYASHQILHGDDFAGLSQYSGLGECLRVSKECRKWYQSDERRLDFGVLDAAAVGKLAQDAVDHVVRGPV